MPTFQGVTDQSQFWSEFIMEYSLMATLLNNRATILSLYDHSLHRPAPTSSRATPAQLAGDQDLPTTHNNILIA